GGGVVVRAVGQLDDVDAGRGAEVVLGVRGGDRRAGARRRRARGRADVRIRTRSGDAGGGEGPGLVRVEQAVAVRVAADEGGVEVVGRVARRPGVVAHRHAGQR